MELSIDDFEEAPSFLNFYTFVMSLIVRDAVDFSEHNNKIINLTPSSSNFFSLGRDENMVPYIGIQKDMINWFFDLNWTEVSYLINKKESRIYLTSRDKEDDSINFVLGMKVKRKRMIVLHDEKTEDLNKSFCNLKVIKAERNGDSKVSFNNIISELPIYKIKSEKELMDESLGDNLNKNNIKLMFLNNKK